MTIQKLLTIGLAILFLSSCNLTHKLSDNDFRWMPYKGTETLVFNSNAGTTDTIFLIRTMRYIYSRDQLFDPFPPKLEHFSISSKHTDPNYDRYLEGPFIELFATKEKNNATFTLGLKAKDSWFYGSRRIHLNYLDSSKQITLQTKIKTYTDIIILTPESNEYSDRSNFVTKVYWSKTEGLIRFDKKDSVYWELTKKYGP